MRKSVWIIAISCILGACLLFAGGHALMRFSGASGSDGADLHNTQASSAQTTSAAQSTGSTSASQAADERAQRLKSLLAEAKSLLGQGKYKEALDRLSQSDAADGSGEAAALRADILTAYRTAAIDGAREKIGGYDYAGAAALLSPYLDRAGSDAEAETLLKVCRDFQTTEPFTGTVEHVFFHPLIAYPELAFDGDSVSKGLDEYFVTVSEFKKTIEQLYERDYVLIDPHLLYHVEDDGSVTKLALSIPEGKKPLILSADDYNFLEYMRKNGCVSGLTLDGDGNVVTFTNQSDGTHTYSDDNELVPILDRFVAEHPDFSYGGFKGVIALTGYQGALGYPTDQLDAPDYAQTLAAAKAVADRMKATGWAFASHSYGHNHFEKRTLDQMKADTDKWRREVGAVVGDTDLYIYPFGEIIPQDDAKFRYLVESGFHYFAGVSQYPYLKYYGDNLLQTRRNIDGIALRGKHLPEILDTQSILDPVRPKADD